MKYGCKMDMIGRRMYPIVSLVIRRAGYQGVTEEWQTFLMNKICSEKDIVNLQVPGGIIPDLKLLPSGGTDCSFWKGY